MVGDMPDVQGLFIEQMDHAICAIRPVNIAFIPYAKMVRALEARPRLGFAVWRKTPIDAAIFRAAIANNRSPCANADVASVLRTVLSARTSGLIKHNQLAFPAGLVQIGEGLGMSIATVNRTRQRLRATGAADFRESTLRGVFFLPSRRPAGRRRRVSATNRLRARVRRSS